MKTYKKYLDEIKVKFRELPKVKDVEKFGNEIRTFGHTASGIVTAVNKYELDIERHPPQGDPNFQQSLIDLANSRLEIQDRFKILEKDFKDLKTKMKVITK